MDEPIPDLVLCDTLWNFAGQDQYELQAAFEEAVRRYHIEVHEHAPDIQPDECWQPSAVVLGVARMVVRFESETPGREQDCEVELTSDNGESFTAGELLYKFHNSAVGRLRDNHHSFFEGFELSAVTPEGVPEYTLRLGS